MTMAMRDIAYGGFSAHSKGSDLLERGHHGENQILPPRAGRDLHGDWQPGRSFFRFQRGSIGDIFAARGGGLFIRPHPRHRHHPGGPTENVVEAGVGADQSHFEGRAMLDRGQGRRGGKHRIHALLVQRP